MIIAIGEMERALTRLENIASKLIAAKPADSGLKGPLDESPHPVQTHDESALQQRFERLQDNHSTLKDAADQALSKIDALIARQAPSQPQLQSTVLATPEIKNPDTKTGAE